MQLYGQNGLQIEMDRATCRNGDNLTMSLTVPANALRGTDLRYSLLSKISDGTAHMWRGMVHVK